MSAPILATKAFSEAIHFTLDQECRGSADEMLLNDGITGQKGALVDHHSDKGGRTAYGVTQAVYDAYRVTNGLTTRDVWLIEAQEVVDIYFRDYWSYFPMLLPRRLAIAVFDTAVLHGRTYAAKRLQIALGLVGDGDIGPKTQTAIQGLSDGDSYFERVLREFMQARDDRYEQIVGKDGTQKVFYAGWEARCDKLCDFIGIPRTTDLPR